MDPASAIETIPNSKDVTDTQIMSQEVYDRYYSEREPLKHLDSISNAVKLVSETNECASGTYATGETGHVDLALETGDENKDDHHAVVDDESADELGLDPDTQIRIETTTSPRCLLPNTLITAGQKRDHRGNVKTPVNRTPGPDLAAMFPVIPKDAVMGLSQLFAQTQAPSSPFPAGPRSDSIFARPSPGFPDMELSSPTGTMSSPALTRRTMQRATTDPRDIYVSLKVSQEQRAYKVQQEELTILQPSLLRDSDDEVEPDENSEQRRAEWRRHKTTAESALMKDFDGLRAPTLRRKVDRRRKVIERESVTKMVTMPKDKEKEVIFISDDASPAQNEEESCTSEVDSMDQYDELSQTVIPSERSDGGSGKRPIQVPKTVTKQRMNGSSSRPMSSPLPRTEERMSNSRMKRSVLAGPDLQFVAEGVISQDRFDVRGTQTSAVPETQPLPPRPLLYSSYNSKTFVSQSQGLSWSSNIRTQLPVTPILGAFQSSSIAPPLSSQANNGGANDLQKDSPGTSLSDIASSPPAVMRLEKGHDSLEHVLASSLSDDYKPGTSTALSQANESVQSHHNQQRFSLTPPERAQSRRLNYSIAETSPATMPRTHNLLTTYPASASFPGSGSRSRLRTQDNSAHARSISTGVYNTAQTHQSAPPTRSQSSRPQLKAIYNSPGIQRLRNMTEITADLTATGLSDQAMDININIMNDEDIEFQDVVSKSSPRKSQPSKMRKVNILGRALREPAKEINSMAPPTSPSTRSREMTRSGFPFGDHHDDASNQTPARPENKKRRRPSTKRKRRPQTEHNAVVAANNPPADEPREIAETPQTANKDSPAAPQRNVSRVAAMTRTSEVQHDPKTIEGPGNLALQIPAQLSAAIVALPGEPIIPRRVFARFRGKIMAFYPATCLGLVSPGATAYSIRFDDETRDNVQPSLVRSLDLRIGDLVRVDLCGMRTKSYVVRGLRDQIKDVPSEPDFVPQTDIRGYKTVVVEAKLRASFPGGNRLQVPQFICVPITSIYLIGTMWPYYADRLRLFDYIPSAGTRDTRLQTPVDMPSIPTTPSSRTRRHTLLPTVGSAAPVSTTLLDTPSSVFSNMAFAISYSSQKETEKANITRLILENGGRVLDEGFDELFILPALFPTSPSKSPRRTISTISNTPTPLTLCPSATNLGFTALIADIHSRRAKYMQALALNIPCLSGRWIFDCISRNQLLAWDRYLLPAGESAFLDGAVRSRTFSNSHTTSTDAAVSRLKDTIEQRPRLLDGHSVVLVMGKGKAEEKRKAYLFLTHALGARRVERVRDVAAAKRLVEGGEEWGWVYVEDGKLEGARQELVRDVEERKGKKRKRGGALAGGNGDGRKGGVKVVGDDFVVQSLILGALLEE